MSKIAVVGAGYVGLTTAACFAHLGHDVVCADIDPDRIARLEQGELPIVEDGLGDLVRDGDAQRPAAVRGRRGTRRRPTRSSSTCACPRRRAPDGSADLSYVEAAAGEIGPLLDGRVDRREQVDRAGRLDPHRPAGAPALGRPRRLEPGVPPRGLGGARLPAPRPHRDRLRRPGRGHPGGQPVPRHRGPAHRHRPAVGRDHQVRVERVPRHQAQLRQRGGRDLRVGRGRRQRRRARHGLRHAHRPRVPAARSGLGRILPAEGHAGAHAHRRRRRLRLRPPARRRST